MHNIQMETNNMEIEREFRPYYDVCAQSMK